MPLTWKIYYPSSTFSNLDGNPEDAPSIGVVCIKQVSKRHGSVITAFKDFYLWHDGEWWGCDEYGYMQYMFEPGLKIVKFGVSVSHDEFDRIMGLALDDKDFPEKTAKSPMEFKGED